MKAKKSLGQNFLQDQIALQNIISAGNINKDDRIIEIGPGKGALTKQLIETNCEVIAVELDDRLIPLLHKTFTDCSNFQLIHQDALTYEPPTDKPYKVIANIPYYITSPIITHFLLEQFQRQNLPTTMVLLIQKEVAEKICDPNRYSVISMGVRLFGTPEYIATVKSEAFNPAPKVDSAIIRISDIKPPYINNPEAIMKLVKMGFSSPRKKLAGNLAAGLHIEKNSARALLEKAQIDINHRAENLKVEDWIRLKQFI